MSLQPVQVLSAGADEERAETARLVSEFFCRYCFIFLIYTIFCLQSSFIGAVAIGDLVKSTLGPKGMVRCKFIFGINVNYTRCMDATCVVLFLVHYTI